MTKCRAHTSISYGDSRACETHFDTPQGSNKSRIVEVSEVADAEHLRGELAESHAKRNIEVVQNDASSVVCIVTVREQNSGEHG
jgi:hypothetical protein